MAIHPRLSKKSDKSLGDQIIENQREYMTEEYQSMFSSVRGVQSYNFIQAMRRLDSTVLFDLDIYDRMMGDGVVSSAIDLIVEDALQIDTQKGKICWIELETSDEKNMSKEEKENIDGLQQELMNFLHKEVKIEELLPAIGKRILVYGDSPIRLEYIDKLEDDKTILVKNESEGSPENNFLSEAEEFFKSNNYSEYYKDHKTNWVNYLHNSHKLNEAEEKDIYDVIDPEAQTSQDGLRQIEMKPLGRYYVELVGNGSDIYAIGTKGKIIGYIDRYNLTQILDPDSIIPFLNKGGWNRVVLETGTLQTPISEKDYYTIEKGESYLKNARIPWLTLSTVEDIILLTRMTRSLLYRIFSIEVGSKGSAETMKILKDLKEKIKSDETIDLKRRIYEDNLSALPLGDSIFIPTRNGVGAIKVDTVGGDMNLTEAYDLDYFKDKLFAALRIPKTFLGFEKDMPGGLNATSLTRMDIRYSRTVRHLQGVIARGLKELCLKYLKMTRSEIEFRALPDFEVCLTSINTAEDSERIQAEVEQFEGLGKLLDSFDALGVDVTKNKDLRNELIQNWIGSDYLEIIKKWEEEHPDIEPTDGGKGPSGSGPTLDTGPDNFDDFDGEEPETIDTDNTEDNEEPEDTDITGNEPAPGDDIVDLGPGGV